VKKRICERCGIRDEFEDMRVCDECMTTPWAVVVVLVAVLVYCAVSLPR
jgi:NMD protein affecting ribosome stability and mRNA decay